MRHCQRLTLLLILVIACAVIYANWTPAGVMVIESPRPGSNSPRNWTFQIQVPDKDAPLKALLTLQKHIPRQLESGNHTYTLNPTATVLVPITSKMSSIVACVDVEPSSKHLEATSNLRSRITLKLMDSAGKLLGVESVETDGHCGNFGFANRHPHPLSLQEIKLVKLELLDDNSRNTLEVIFQFANRQN